VDRRLSIEIVNVSKTYVTLGRRKQVFKDLNLSFPRDLSVGIIGPNGCGKSTLLRLIAGADQPDRGYVRRNVRLSWPVGFGGVADSTLSGVANARFCARLYGADPDEVVERTTEFSGLGALMHWPVKTYSSGMRSRLNFAMSMAIDFDCLLIDEVLSVGDVEFRAKCAAALEARRGRSNFLMVTHNVRDIVRMCDRVVILGGPVPIVSDDVSYTLTRFASQLGGLKGVKHLVTP
jgi:capsular polysaccharide transport system ATP-binding protein